MVLLPFRGSLSRSSGLEEPLCLPDALSVARPSQPHGPGGGACAGAARRRVKSGTLGMALATAIPPGEENKGPILCVGINSKSHLGCHSSPDRLPEECKRAGGERERVGEARRSLRQRCQRKGIRVRLAAGVRPARAGPWPNTGGSPAVHHRCTSDPAQDRGPSCDSLIKGSPSVFPFPRMAAPFTTMCLSPLRPRAQPRLWACQSRPTGLLSWLPRLLPSLSGGLWCSLWERSRGWHCGEPAQAPELHPLS